MKNLTTIFLTLILAIAIISCGETAKEKQQRKLIDSLEAVNYKGQMKYDDLQKYLSVIADGLDSIAIEEHELLLNNSQGENTGYNRQRMKQNLDHVREILSRHRDRIDSLESRLANSQGDTRNLRTIITALREQLEAKEQELAQLKKDLESNKRTVAQLTNKVQEISAANEAQEQTIAQQQETIDQYAEQMSKGYVKIASKNDLKAAGLLSTGFLKKAKVDYSNIDLSQFEVVDTRTFKTIELPKKYKILTSVPSDSYTIVKTSDGNILQVLDTEKFWSVSNFLIIQIN